MPNTRTIRHDQADEHPVFRLFRDMPGRNLIDDFLAHIRTTAEPESFAGIHPGPLDKTEPFRKLTPFSIDRRKRADGSMAYCPMCRQYNKFREGAFVYLPRLQAVAAIGHECAAKENRAAAERDYRTRRDREIEENYLLANLPDVPAKLTAISQVRPAAAEALRVFRLLRKNAPSVQRQLRSVKQQDRRLIVAETIADNIAVIGPSGFRRADGRQTRDVVFGLLAGTTAVINNYDPVTELDNIELTLKPYATFPTEEAALDAICEMDPDDRKRATIQLRNSDGAFRKFQNRIEDFCAFFSPDNIRRINAWTSHPEHPAQFTITRTSKPEGINLTIQSIENPLFRATISPVITAYQAKWPYSTI